MSSYLVNVSRVLECYKPLYLPQFSWSSCIQTKHVSRTPAGARAYLGLEDAELRPRLSRDLVLGNYGCLGDLDSLRDTYLSPTFDWSLGEQKFFCHWCDMDGYWHSTQGHFPWDSLFFCFSSGSGEKGVQPTILQAVKVDLYRWDWCGYILSLLTKNMLCAGTQDPGKDACQVRGWAHLGRVAGFSVQWMRYHSNFLGPLWQITTRWVGFNQCTWSYHDLGSYKP